MASNTPLVQQISIEMASDYKYIRASMFGVGVTKDGGGKKSAVLTIFEDEIVPAIEDGQVKGLSKRRKVVANIEITSAGVKLLREALNDVMNSVEESSQPVISASTPDESPKP